MTFAAPKYGTWQSLLAESISTPSEIACRLGVSAESISEVTARYPARINPYALSLIRSAGGDPFMIDDSRLFSVALITVDKTQEPERK